jgi:hypothetical protein
LPYKCFKTEQVRKEIRELGVYSAFSKYKNEISLYHDKEILLLADAADQYGQNWRIILSPYHKKKKLLELTQRPYGTSGIKSAGKLLVAMHIYCCL